MALAHEGLEGAVVEKGHGLKSACNCSYLNYLLNLKNGVRKSALEQGGLSCYIVERERGFIGFGEERDREIVCIRGII